MRSRIRTIKPELFQHEGLYDLEKETGLPIRAAWAGLFTVCDREGRFEWRPRALKANILPYDEVEFSRVLDAWATRGFVVKYASLDGLEYGFIPSWHLHQVLNNREQASTLPDPATCVIQPTSTRAPRVPDACPTPLSTAQAEGKGTEGNGTTPSRNGDGDHAGRDWARPYYDPWKARFGGNPNVGLLRKMVAPLEQSDGREVTMARWLRYLPGVNIQFSGKGDPFRNALVKFVGAPKTYDDPDWFMTAADRRALEGV